MGENHRAHTEMHPSCEVRFISIDEALETHGRQLDEQGAQLIRVEESLKRHSRVISRLEAQMGQTADAQHENSRQLAHLVTSVDHISKDMSEIKKMQWKLIGVLVAALAILAGVNKVSELGLF